MILSIHIFIAVSSLLAGGIAAVRPIRGLFLTNYSLIAATFLSGIVLVAQHPTHLSMACLSGLAYLAVVATLLAFAQRRLAARQTTQK